MSEALSKQQFDSALKLYKLESFEEARKAFLQLVKTYPQHSEIWLNLGNAEFQLNALPNAEKSWKRCLDTNPLEPNAYLNLGNLYFKQKRYQKALNYWHQFVTLKPNQATVWLNMGLAYEERQDLDQAFKHYKHYMQLNPSSTQSRQLKQRTTTAQTISLRNVNTAEQALGKGHFKKAHEAFQKAFSQYPGNAKSYKTFAALLYKQNKRDEALKYYLKSYACAAEDTGVLVNLGVIYEKQKEYTHAIWAYHRAIECNTADREKVQKRLDLLMQNHGDHLSKVLEQAESEINRGHFEEAEILLTRLQEVVVLQPELGPPLQKQIERLGLQTNPKRRAAITYYQEGEKARAEGKYDQALVFYRQYLTAYPEGPKAAIVLEHQKEVEAQIGQVIATMMTMDKPLKELQEQGDKKRLESTNRDQPPSEESKGASDKIS